AAAPTPFAVTLPIASTVATDVSVLNALKFVPGTGDPVPSRAVRDRGLVSPTAVKERACGWATTLTTWGAAAGVAPDTGSDGAPTTAPPFRVPREAATRNW